VEKTGTNIIITRIFRDKTVIHMELEDNGLQWFGKRKKYGCRGEHQNSILR
jgi:hypothetical protein